MEAFRRDLGKREHDSEPECQPNRLPQHEIGIPAASAVERHEPERRERQHPDEQERIQMQPPGQEDPGLHHGPQPGTALASGAGTASPAALSICPPGADGAGASPR